MIKLPNSFLVRDGRPYISAIAPSLWNDELGITVDPRSIINYSCPCDGVKCSDCTDRCADAGLVYNGMCPVCGELNDRVETYVCLKCGSCIRMCAQSLNGCITAILMSGEASSAAGDLYGIRSFLEEEDDTI